MIFFVRTLIVSQAILRDYYRVLKRLQKCEGIDVLRQAGVLSLCSSIPPAEGGVLVLRDTRVLRLLQHVSSFLLQAVHLRLTKGAIVSLSDRSASAGRDDLV
jgi:hypothetical protein